MNKEICGHRMSTPIIFIAVVDIGFRQVETTI